MNLSNVVIVLNHPEESRNIGAVCRAMANNDICSLRIVGKLSDYDVNHIKTLAIHAGNIFDNAKFYDSLTNATDDCVFLCGTTRRTGKKRGKLLLPEDLSKKVSKTNGKVAIVFGNERTGLTDEQLSLCNFGVTIPSSNKFGSLNLSHAVQIICYELYKKDLQIKKRIVAGVSPITQKRLLKTVKTITDNLQNIGFFKMPGRKDMESFWKNILSRSELTEGEAQYIEKTFTKMSGLARKNNQNGDNN